VSFIGEDQTPAPESTATGHAPVRCQHTLRLSGVIGRAGRRIFPDARGEPQWHLNVSCRAVPINTD
jgi:hypothetical protein